MRILLTNDDGIYAPGLKALYNELKHDFDIDIVAPLEEMSATSHAITLSHPLRVQKVHIEDSFWGYGTTGTPVDCVKIAVQELLKVPPDIVLSGINPGANVGVNALYSGTVAAGIEGAFLGVKSAAISLDARNNPDFRTAARFSREIIHFMMKHGLKKGTALNVNIPAVPVDQIKGVSITRQGIDSVKDCFECRIDPRGGEYYWITGEKPTERDNADADIYALQENRISITPVCADLTCLEEADRLKGIPFPTAL